MKLAKIPRSNPFGARFIRRLRIKSISGFLLALSLALSSSAGFAGTITIPWTVDLTIPAGPGNDPLNPEVPPFEASYTAFDFAPPIGPDLVGLDLVTEFEHSYSLRLPFEIQISAPDQVSPGQFVTFDSSARLVGDPYFTTAGNVDFNSEIFVDSVRESLGPPDEVGFGGLSLTVAGERSYTDTDTTAEERLTRTIWKEDRWGNPLQLNRAERFEGYQFQTTGDEDAWGGKLAILDFASNFIPPLALVSNILDLAVGPEFDIIEQTYLMTQFVTGFYTDDGGATYDDFLINGADRRGYLTIPDTLNPGDTYDIQMTAFGLGFTTLFEYFLQGNIDIELEILFGLFDVDIAEIDLGDPFLIDSWADRFQIIEFMNPEFDGFLSEEEFLNAALSFEIVGGLEDLDPDLTAPGWQVAQVDPLIGQLIDSEASPYTQGYRFPGDPPSASVVVTAVPEPSTLALLGLGLLTLVVLQRLGRGPRSK